MPLPPAYLFLIDVSYNSVRSGLLSLWASTMMTLLNDLPKEEGQDASTIQVGFITYSKAIHFYNVKVEAEPIELSYPFVKSTCLFTRLL